MLSEKIQKRELGRFFQVALLAEINNEDVCYMPSCLIDEFWHSFEKQEKQFAKFTMNLVNTEVEHINDYEAYPEYKGEGYLSWTPLYHQMFGILPVVWFTDSKGIVDEQSYKQYCESYLEQSKNSNLLIKPQASWSCTPSVKPQASWSCTPSVSVAA